MAVDLGPDGLTLGSTTINDWADVGGGGTFEATASGAITAGDPCVLNTDGTVSAVSGTFTDQLYDEHSISNVTLRYQRSGIAVDESTSTGLIVASTASNYTSRAAWAFTFNSDGTVNTEGSTAVSVTTDTLYDPVLVKIGTNKFFLAANNSNTEMSCYVFTVSGTTVTKGAEKIITTDDYPYVRGLHYDSSTDRVYVFFQEYPSYHFEYIVCSVSGTTITSGSAQSIESSNAHGYTYTAYDGENNRVLAAYDKGTTALYGKIGTLGASSITWGSEFTIESGDADKNNSELYNGAHLKPHGYSADYDKWVITTTTGNPLNFWVGASDGSSWTKSTFTVDQAATNYMQGLWNPETNTASLVERFQATAIQMASDGSLSKIGSFSYGDLGSEPEPRAQYTLGQAILSNNAHIFGPDNTSNNLYTQNLGDLNDSNLTSSNYIGVAESTVSSGATATIQLGGVVDTNQSGLTTGTIYHVDPDGSVVTEANKATVLSPKLGIATDTTNLLLKDPLS